jgi:hypothetical protein
MTDVRTIIATTTEDDRHASVREAAIERALREHATLILYDLDAATSPLESPLPTGWSAEGTEETVGDRLGPEELEAAGRSAIAGQVRSARAEGVDAWAWLPEDDDGQTLVAYAARQPGALVLLPDDEPDLIDDQVQSEIVRSSNSAAASSER